MNNKWRFLIITFLFIIVVFLNFYLLLPTSSYITIATDAFLKTIALFSGCKLLYDHFRSPHIQLKNYLGIKLIIAVMILLVSSLSILNVIHSRYWKISTTYYKNYSLGDKEIIGQTPINILVASRTHSSFVIKTKNNRTLSMERVNPHRNVRLGPRRVLDESISRWDVNYSKDGELVSYLCTTNFLAKHLLKFTEDRSSLDYIFHVNGKPTQSILQAELPRFALAYTGSSLPFSLKSYPDLSKITRVKILVADGSISGLHYLQNNEGIPAQDSTGIYGIQTRHEGAYQTRAFLDDNYETVNNSSGYAQDQMILDGKGNIIEIKHLDSNDSESLNSYGVSRIIYKNDDFGNVTHLKYVRENGSVLYSFYGFHQATYKYDLEGNIESAELFDGNGNPRECSLGYQRVVYGYNINNQCTKIQYFAKNGSPATDQAGFHKYDFMYNDSGLLSGVTFYDNVGLMRSTDGKIAHYAISYDDFNNIASIQFRGENETNITVKHLGYSALAFEYDLGVVTVKYKDSNGNPVKSNDGDYGFTIKSDLSRNAYVITYYQDPSCTSKFTHPIGYASMRLCFNAQGKHVSTEYFDIGGSPAISTLGFHKTQRIFDSFGRLLETAHYLTDGTRAKDKNGVAIYKYIPSARGLLLEESFYDQNESLCPNNLGYARCSYEHDEFGHVKKIVFFDQEGNSTFSTTTYDEDLVFFYGHPRKKIPVKYSEVHSEYHEDHRLKEKTFYLNNNEKLVWYFPYDGSFKQSELIQKTGVTQGYIMSESAADELIEKQKSRLDFYELHDIPGVLLLDP